MKKIISVCVAVIIIALMFTVTAIPATATTVENGELQAEITLSSTSVKINKTVDVTIAIKNTTSYEITDLYYKFTYDNNAFGIVSYPATPAKTMFNQNGGVIEASYTATNRGDMAPIAVGATATVTFTMQATTNATPGATLAFSVSDMKAYMRTNVTSSSIAGSNLAHTFTFKPTSSVSVGITSLSNDANLTSIVPIVNNSEIAMSPAFSPDITSYYVVVTYSIPDFKFNWVKSDAAASVEYVPPANNTLTVGENTFQFIVTAEDKVTKKTYTAVVKRLALGETTAAEITTTTEITTVTEETTTVTTTGELAVPTDATTTANDESRGEEDFRATVSLTLWTLLGLVIAQIALFLLAFFAGYMTHKNATKPAEPTLNDMLAAQQMQMMQYMQPAEEPEEEEPEEEEFEENEEEQEFSEGEQYAGGYYGGEYGQGSQGTMPVAGQYGQFYDQQGGMGSGFSPSEFGVQQTPEYRPHEDEYDEYGYNIYGESNVNN